MRRAMKNKQDTGLKLLLVVDVMLGRLVNEILKVKLSVCYL